MMRALAALAVVAAPAWIVVAPAWVEACPACASAQRGGPSWVHLVLVLLPFVIVGLAARAIRAALADDRLDD